MSEEGTFVAISWDGATVATGARKMDSFDHQFAGSVTKWRGPGKYI